MKPRSYVRGAAAGVIQASVLLFALPSLLIRLGLKLLGSPRTSYWTGVPILTLVQKAESERLTGAKVVVIVRYTYRLSQDFDVVLTDFCKGRAWLAFPLSGLACLWMICTASRVHTFADGGILPGVYKNRIAFAELWLYRIFRIPHIVWTYGSDVRTRQTTKALGSPNCCTDCTRVGTACRCDDRAGRDNIQRLQRAGSIVFSMGDMLEYTPGSRNDLFFWPLDIDGRHQPLLSKKSSRGTPDRPLRVVHAPNHREFKGTRYLETAVAELKAEGVPIELVMVEKLPNHEALAVYQTADVIFDQCLIGFHGYFALEAMALGKPVMCYIRKPEQYLLEPHECPIINTHVDTLRDDLRRLVMTRDQLANIGQRGRAYVERHYSRAAFAGRLQRAYQDLGITS
jgi:hypothetical protein